MILLIDNYDSFTYNLEHYFCEQYPDVKVVRNDKITLDEIKDLNPKAIVISPGPCEPTSAGIILSLFDEIANYIPVFGVCLGHQAIGQAYGAKIVKAPYVMHGKVSKIYHNGSGIFKDIPSPFTATRYHSLIIDKDSLRPDIAITAWTDDDIIMGIEHKFKKIYGVQFHPESIESEYGKDIIANFLKIIN